MEDGSGSESWSLIDDEGDLIDSDDYSISESEPPSQKSEINSNPANEHSSGGEDYKINIDGLEYRCIVAPDEFDQSDIESSSSDDTNMTDVEEIEDIELPSIEHDENELFNEEAYIKCSCDSTEFFSLDIKMERRMKIFAFASIVSVMFMGVFFGSLFGVQPIRPSRITETFTEPIRIGEPILSFEPIFEKPMWSHEDEIENEEDQSELYQCHQNLNDVVKRASLNSVLMRYMRSKNSRLESLIQELQSFVDTQRQEIESLQQATEAKTPLQSLAESPLATDLPCVDSTDLDNSHPTDQPSTQLPPPSFLPDEHLLPEFDKCIQKERSFFNLTRTFFNNMAMMANSTALTLFVDSRPELVRFTSWLQNQTLKALPRMVENVKSGWQFKFRSYMQKVSNALSSPSITSITKHKSVVGSIKRQIKSVFNRLSQSKWLKSDDEEVCISNSTCDLLMEFGNYLATDKIFQTNLTPKQADSYISFLKHIPSRQCTANSTLVSCERCWWTGKCDGIKKGCSPRRWQKQRRIDPKQFIEGSSKVKEIFKPLGWIDTEIQELSLLSEPVGPPRRKAGRKNDICREDWLTRRSSKRAEHRRIRSSSGNSWFFERHAQRKAIRQSEQASDWMFDRVSQRNALRQN